MEKSKKYKALIFDLDGTCVKLGLGNMPSERVIKAVSDVMKQRIPVSVASGRNIQQAADVIEALGITEPCMLSNGATIYEPSTKAILECTPIDAQSLIQIHDIVKNDAEKIVVSSPYTEHRYTSGGFGEQVVSLFVEKLTKEKALYYVDKLEKISTLSVHSSDKSFDGVTTFISINEVRATKQRALSHLLHRLSISAPRVVAVGDGENDLPMIIAAGMGVAMGNAAEGLKSVADYIAPSVDEDGLAYVIEKFFPAG